MAIELIDLGGSSAFDEVAVDAMSTASRMTATLIVGGDALARACALARIDRAASTLIAVELGTECLGFHLDQYDQTQTHVLGFARFCLGSARPSDLIEVVRSTATSQDAVDRLGAIFDAAGLSVAICNDVPGRIVDSLLRPFLNAALAAADEGLASPDDMDTALRLGLGHPQGPCEALHETGLDAHFRITGDLYEALGKPEFHPARQARVYAKRKKAGLA